MQLPHWQFITQGRNPDEHLLFAQEAVEGGCPWVQLRMKNVSPDVFFATATKLQKICDANNALLFINDNVEVAKAIQADGIHLGKNDMPPSEARKILHSTCIIGGTANTWEDIQRLQKEQVDYIGLGPFRFTTTKEQLSPVLGQEGYKEILQKMNSNRYNIPIFAIGGITLDDIETFQTTGVHGIAISGLVAKAPNIKAMVDVLTKKLTAWKN